MGNEDERKYDRDAAVEINIVGSGETEPDPIVSMCSRDGYLEIFKTQSIFRVHSPEDLDPARENPTAPWLVKESFDQGTSNPYVARTFLQCEQLLKSVHLGRDIDGHGVLNACHTCMEQLLVALNCAYRITIQTAEIVQSYPQVMAAQDEDRILGNVPQVRNLDADVQSYLLASKRALNSHLDMFNQFFGTNFEGAQFHRALNWADEKFGPDDPISHLLRDDQPWIVRLIGMRNAVEHPKQGKNLEVRNFHVTASRQLSPPVWRLESPDAEQNTESSIVVDMETYLNNLLTFGEELLVLSLQKTTAGNFPYTFFEIPEEERDKTIPLRFRVGVDASQLCR